MPDLEDPRREPAGVVARKHRDRFLTRDRARVGAGVDEVDRRSRDLHTVLEGLFLAVLGCLAGVPLGVLLLKGLAAIRSVGPDGRVDAPFLIEIDPMLLLGASVVAIVTGAVASYFPARRAGQVDPIQVIRGS